MKILNTTSFKPSRLSVALIATAIAVCAVHSSSFGATQLIADFGDGGWYSWDTRNAVGGATFNGTNDTSPDINSFLLGRAVGSSTAADDTAIEKQIVFMDEGQSVNDSIGGTPPPGPAGSLNGLGYVRLDGSGSNSGKSDLSYVDTNGIASGADLLDPSFSLGYRYYIQPNPTFRTLGLNLAVVGSDNMLYIFSHIQDGSGGSPTAVTGWNTETVSATVGGFRLFVAGAPSQDPSVLSLDDWSSTTTAASAFASGAELFRIGYNIGSGQQAGLEYLDWTQTNLLNGGDIIDFVGPSAVPEPGTWVAGSLAMALLLLQRGRVSGVKKDVS